MRKLVYTLAAVILLALSSNVATAASNDKGASKPLTSEQQVQLQRIEQRVQEIKNMDKSDLNRSDKRALKKELKEMNEQARVISGGGVYLSVGAIIIIILLLILIL